MDNTNKREKSMQMFTKIIVALALMWAILPILVLGENYVYTIHDGLDSYAGFVQRLHDNHMYFRLSEKMPFMNDIEGKYAMFSYTLYDALNCLLGYRTGQILTRVIGVLLGFGSMRMLLHRIYSNRDTYQESMISLLSVAYAITPVAPIRMLGYASLPLVIYIYLFLRKEKSFSYVVFVAILLPLLSSFQAVYIFVLGFWFVFTVCNVLKNKKINYFVNNRCQDRGKSRLHFYCICPFLWAAHRFSPIEPNRVSFSHSTMEFQSVSFPAILSKIPGFANL